ncbi:MAG: hypothetical protein ACTTIC_07730 [Helicobacteraceae bacterium]
MKANIAKYKHAAQTAAIFAVIIFFGLIATVYPFLPPLFGFMMALLVATDKKYFIPILIFLLFFEAQHNLVIFSSWFFVYFYRRFVLSILNHLLVCRVCIISLTVVLSYLLYYFFNYVFYFILGEGFIGIDWSILLSYIAAEVVLAVLFI